MAALARSLRRTEGRPRSLRSIADELAAEGYVALAPTQDHSRDRNRNVDGQQGA